jgi:hypothetical protein
MHSPNEQTRNASSTGALESRPLTRECRPFLEFHSRRAGMIHAMDGGLWLHRHMWYGKPMAHLVSTNREWLIDYGRSVGLPLERLQYKPLKDPRTGERRDAWHWDLGGPYLPARDDAA